MTCRVAKTRVIPATPHTMQFKVCCTSFRRPVPFQYQPETMELEGIGIPDDETVFYPGTPQELTGHDIWTFVDNRYINIKNRLGFTLGEFNLDKVLTYLYLYLGGTATFHKYNAMDAQDTDAAFRITWFGGVVHDELGITGNGVNAYGDTHMIANVEFGSSHSGFGHRRTNYTVGIPQGGQTNASGQDYEWGDNNGASLGGAFTVITGINDGTIGMVRVNGTQFNYIKNGVNTVVAQAFVANPDQSDSLLCFSTTSPTLHADCTMPYALRFVPGATVAQAIIILDELDGLQTDLNR